MRKTESHILIIDDDEDILFAARIYLKRFFTQITTLSTPKTVLHELNSKVIDVVLMDMNYRKGVQDGKEGMYWFERVKEYSPETVVVLMTAFSDVNVAVESIKKGAFDFVLKPWNNEKLLATIQAAVKLSRSLNKSAKLEQMNKPQEEKKDDIVLGKSPAFLAVKNVVDKVSDTDANILLLGENGTGKYVIADMIHQKSGRNKEAFVHIDLGSLNENLFESELFGYAKGAFTDAKENRMGRFELAHKGTIFLDEIGNLPLHLQSKLLTVIQERKVVRLGESKERSIDVRIICATNANIVEEVAQQKFRQDLLYRINTVSITLPPLRERQEDIPLFAKHFLGKIKRKYKKEELDISKEAFTAMKGYHWPGNIRELEHVIERAIILCDGSDIEPSDLQFTASPHAKQEKNTGPATLNLEEMEKYLVQKALKKHRGNITKAATELGLTRAALYRRLEKFEL